MSERDDQQPDIRISISPEPSDDEVAAVAAMITAMAASAGDDEGESNPAPQVERWALAGRHEAMRGALWPNDQRD
jgi:hypothetical protein